MPEITKHPEPIVNVRQYLQCCMTTAKNDRLRLFRGQPKAFPLLPSLFRGDPDVTKVVEAELAMMAAFRKDSPYLLPISLEKDNDWDWWSMGQHYGLPTRFLDWSANPLVSLFFALPSTLDASMRPVVYAFDINPKMIYDLATFGCDPTFVKNTMVFRPRNHSARVAMQAGYHTVHVLYNGEAAIQALDRAERHASEMTLFEVNPKNVEDIRSELSHMGISGSTVYGTLDAMSRDIAASKMPPKAQTS